MIVTLTGVNLNVNKVSATTGNPYIAHEIEYMNGDGKAIKRNVFLKSPMANVVTTLKVGDVCTLRFEKDQKGQSNLVGITKGATEQKTGGGNHRTGGGKSTYDSLGAQVGNALKLAVESLGAGRAVSEYENRAQEFMAMGDRIHQRAEKGTIETSVPNFDGGPTVRDSFGEDFDSGGEVERPF